LGTNKERKLLILICLLIVTGIFVYSQNRTPQVIQKSSLKDYFSHLDGFDKKDMIDMPEDTIKMLNLDDYLFANYQGPLGIANLYIGYYYTANKAYAAHSPMVCYPSQGWKIESSPRRGSLQVGTKIIEYEEITTSLGDVKELVMYWYQAGLFTNTRIYKNKIDMGYNKLMNNNEQHAFVRVALPIQAEYGESKKAAIDFIKAFYPQFVKYVTQVSPVSSL
jgi:EpsI family protein